MVDEPKYEPVLCNRAEAIKMIRATKKVQWFVRAGVFLITEQIDPENVRGFETSSHVKVSKELAIKFVNDTLESFEKRNAKIKVTLYGTVAFVG